jgi:replication factor A1
VNIEEGPGAPAGAVRGASPPIQQQQQRAPQQQYQQQQPQQQYQQQQPQQRGGFNNNNNSNQYRQNVVSNRPPSGRDDYSQQIILPISKINFHVQRWTIKARVTQKSDIREFNSPKMRDGKGKLISVDLLDAQGGEIRATMFGEAVDMFAPILEVGKVYYISRGQIKAAYKKTSSLKNDFEITLDRNSGVQLCEEDDASIPAVMFSATPIARIQDLMKDEIVDVVVLVLGVSELVPINTKSGSTMKRTLQLLDSSRLTIDFALWGNHAINFDQDFRGLVGVKGAKVSDFNGRTLTSISTTQISLQPNTPEAHALGNWYEAETQGQTITLETQSLSVNSRGGGGGGGEGGGRPPRERKTFGQIKEEGLGRGKPAYFQCKGMITQIRHDAAAWYNACPTCNKKVNLTNGMWVCDNCNANFTERNCRYLVSMMANDSTGGQWLGAFNEIGEKLFGRPAAEVAQLKEDNMSNEYEAVFEAVNFKTYLFTIRAKEETYQEEQRVKCNIVDMNPLDFVAESKNLINGINQLLIA